MRKTYKETDKIEYRLEHNVGDHYFLQWRFVEPQKFLFFNIHDKWKHVQYYSPGIFSPNDDPNDDIYWYFRGFHLGSDEEANEYAYIKNNITTKKGLFVYYDVKENTDLYFKNLHEHKKWCDKLERNVEKSFEPTLYNPYDFEEGKEGKAKPMDQVIREIQVRQTIDNIKKRSDQNEK